MLVVAPLRRPTSAGVSMPPDEAQDEGHRHAEDHHRRGEQVETQAVPAQGGQEAGADLEADRVHEEDETQLADELAGALLDVHPEVAEGDAHEEDTRDPEAHPANANRAQGETERRHQREDEDRPRRGRAVEEGRVHAALGAPALTPGPPRGPRARGLIRSPGATAFCESSSVPAPCPHVNDCGSPEKLR